MKITNKQNLPMPLVSAVENDDYTAGASDATVTQLITPERIVALRRLHEKEITEDASDRIWALMGKLGHKILEQASSETLTEQRLFTTVNGWVISGQVDLFEKGIIDYKFTSAWAIKDGVKPEWEKQLNLYAWLCRANGIDPTSLKIIAVLRDWSKLEVKRNPDYPQFQVSVLHVPMWEPALAAEYASERVLALQKAVADASVDEELLPECSPEDRWQKPTVWAAMKRGNKRALKLFSSLDSTKAEAFEAGLAVNGATHMEERPGECIRCAHYCSVAPFCSQWQKINNGVPNDSACDQEETKVA